MRFSPRLFLSLALALCLAAKAWADDVYQWSVPVYGGSDRRAYLWIPPNCSHVRGLIVGLNNMQEEHLFQYEARLDRLA